MKNWRIFLLVLLILMLAACETTTDIPKQIETQSAAPEIIETDLPVETSAPAAQVISISNASYIHSTARLTYPIPYRVMWSPDSSRFAVGSNDGFRVFDAVSLNVLNDIQVQDYTLLDFSLAANLFAVTNEWKTIDLLDIATGAKVRTITPEGVFMMAGFSPDGITLLTTSGDEFAIDLWDTQTGNFLTRITGFETAAPVYSVYFAAGGSKLVFVSRGIVQVIDTGSGMLGARLGHEDFVQAWALSPDAKMIATSSAGTTGGAYLPLIQLWAPGDGAPLGTLLNGDMISNALAFSPDGTVMASTTGPTLTLWDISAQHRLGDWTVHAEGITALSFSPDGAKILSASSDGMVLIWMVQ